MKKGLRLDDGISYYSVLNFGSIKQDLQLNL